MAVPVGNTQFPVRFVRIATAQQSAAALVLSAMRVFLDFEATSLGRHGTPIEVGWVFEDGTGEAHLIRPAEGWTDWEGEAEDIHRISRATLASAGEPIGDVAARMVEALGGHELFVSAPSWDGKWLSALLSAAGYSLDSLRLRDSEAAWRETATGILRGAVPDADLPAAVEDILVRASLRDRQPPRHRALADAQQERRRWLDVRRLAEADRVRRMSIAA